MFKWGRYKINEYELRTILLVVVKGELDYRTVKPFVDQNGVVAYTDEFGKLSTSLEGLKMCDEIELEKYRIIKKKL